VSSYIFTSESVAAGHPDKTCDQISDALLDHVLCIDPFARCAFESLVTTDNVIISGETRVSEFGLDHSKIDDIIRDLLYKIGHNYNGFSWDKVKITNLIQGQSADIAIGVDETSVKNEGAGDQGTMFGYACSDAAHNFMPLTIYYAHRILENLHSARLNHIGPDAKSQVSLEYDNHEVVSCNAVVLSVQHEDFLSVKEVRTMVKSIIEASIPSNLITDKTLIYINPTGRFVIGGPVADTGLTGRKIMVDTYGGVAPHGGGAFSGKDPTKVDRSAAYMARYIAKNIVANGIAKRCTIQLSYAIGVSDPVSMYVNTHGTGLLNDYEIGVLIRKNIPLTPRGIREYLNLNRPIYLRTATFGHFGRDFNPMTGEFSWERVDLGFLGLER